MEWTGMRMLRQWIEPGEIAAKDAAWKTAHRFQIEGYEAKKRWAEAERVLEMCYDQTRQKLVTILLLVS